MKQKSVFASIWSIGLIVLLWTTLSTPALTQASIIPSGTNTPEKVIPETGLTAESVLASSQVPAFPGAEGFGSMTAGGRGGKVVRRRDKVPKTGIEKVL